MRGEAWQGGDDDGQLDVQHRRLAFPNRRFRGGAVAMGDGDQISGDHAPCTFPSPLLLDKSAGEGERGREREKNLRGSRVGILDPLECVRATGF